MIGPSIPKTTTKLMIEYVVYKFNRKVFFTEHELYLTADNKYISYENVKQTLDCRKWLMRREREKERYTQTHTHAHKLNISLIRVPFLTVLWNCWHLRRRRVVWVCGNANNIKHGIRKCNTIRKIVRNAYIYNFWIGYVYGILQLTFGIWRFPQNHFLLKVEWFTTFCGIFDGFMPKCPTFPYKMIGKR